MVTSADTGYDWLEFGADRPGAVMNEASLFAFFDGVDVDGVVEFSGMQDATTVDLSGDARPWERLFVIEDQPAAVFSAGPWTVLYQDNSFPLHVAAAIASREQVDRAVLVFWNANSLVQFSLWERGVRVDGFSEFLDQRVGNDTDRLTADMAAVGLDDEAPDDLYQRMMALADRITGEHLSSTFLSRPHVVLGSIPLD